MKLNEKQLRILCAAQLEPEASYAYLGELAGYNAGVVRHTIQRMEELGIIYKRPVITYNTLGYYSVRIYFAFHSSSQNAEQLLNKYLISQPMVAVAFDLGGQFQFGLSLLVKELSKVKEFLHDLQSSTPLTISEKQIAITLTSLFFRRDYFAKLDGGVQELIDNCEISNVTLSNTEKKILSGLTQLEFRSRRDLARQLQIPQSTFEYHLNKLKEKNVFQGMVYSFRERLLDIFQYKLLLYGKSGDSTLAEDIISYARKDPYIQGYFECIGAWDFELEIETFDPKVAIKIRQDIISKFGDRISRADLHQLFQYHKASNRPVYEDIENPTVN